MRDVRLACLGFRFDPRLLVGLALAFCGSCALGAFCGITLGLLGALLGFQLLAFCLFGLKLQFQLAALCFCLGFLLAADSGLALSLCALLCFALGLLGGFTGDALLAFLLLTLGGFGAEAFELGLLCFVCLALGQGFAQGCEAGGLNAMGFGLELFPAFINLILLDEADSLGDFGGVATFNIHASQLADAAFMLGYARRFGPLPLSQRRPHLVTKGIHCADKLTQLFLDNFWHFLQSFEVVPTWFLDCDLGLADLGGQ